MIGFFSNRDGGCLLRGTDCMIIFNPSQYTTLHSDCWAWKLYGDSRKVFHPSKCNEALKRQNTLQQAQIISVHGIASYHKTPRVMSIKTLQEKTGTETERTHVIRIAYKLYCNKAGKVLIM